MGKRVERLIEEMEIQQAEIRKEVKNKNGIITLILNKYELYYDNVKDQKIIVVKQKYKIYELSK